jgi:hypothetical protein
MSDETQQGRCQASPSLAGSARRSAPEIAEGLEKLHAAAKQVAGEQWEPTVTEQTPLIQGLMEKMRVSNPLKAILPVVKGMPPSGERDLIVAVAVEMVYRQNAEAMAPADK